MDLIYFQRNLQSIDVWEVLKPVIESHFTELLKMTKEQLGEGLNEFGAMPDYASDVYADFKKQHVPTYKVYPTTDLRLTGGFYSKFTARVNLLGIEIESLDKKAQALEAKYGSGIYGLNEEGLTKFIDLIIDEFRTALLNAMLK